MIIIRNLLEVDKMIRKKHCKQKYYRIAKPFETNIMHYQLKIENKWKSITKNLFHVLILTFSRESMTLFVFYGLYSKIAKSYKSHFLNTTITYDTVS